MRQFDHPLRRGAPRLLPVVTVALAMATWQCKPSDKGNSTAKSLDNVAASPGAQVDHICGSTYDGSAALPSIVAPLVASTTAITVPAGDTTSRNLVLGTLSAVPSPLVDLFFNVFNGQIQIGDAVTACKVAPLTNAQQPLMTAANQVVNSCWLSATSDQPLRMVLTPDATVIRSSLVRLFAYWDAEFFMEGILRPNIPAPFNTDQWQTYAQGFIATRGQLASAFLSDLNSLSNVNLNNLITYNTQDTTGFGNLVYANAVDSYYCSTATRTDFQTEFKSTWGVFNDATNANAPAKELGTAVTSF